LWVHSYLSNPTIAEMVKHLRERGLRNFAVEKGLIILF
jgi:Mn-dependent DtxR family transcriptional regulator